MCATGFAVPKIFADVYIGDRSFFPFAGWYEVAKHYLGDDYALFEALDASNRPD